MLCLGTCFVCDKVITEDEPHEPFGLDGDFIHVNCKPHLDDAYDRINNMSDDEFIKYILGK